MRKGCGQAPGGHPYCLRPSFDTTQSSEGASKCRSALADYDRSWPVSDVSHSYVQLSMNEAEPGDTDMYDEAGRRNTGDGGAG